MGTVPRFNLYFKRIRWFNVLMENFRTLITEFHGFSLTTKKWIHKIIKCRHIPRLQKAYFFRNVFFPCMISRQSNVIDINWLKAILLNNKAKRITSAVFKLKIELCGWNVDYLGLIKSVSCRDDGNGARWNILKLQSRVSRVSQIKKLLKY